MDTLIVDDFLPLDLAEALRADIDAHFSKPFEHRPDTHQLWNYWFVPQVYTFLRTQPEKVIQRTKVDRFMTTLRTWSTDTLGLARISWPYLSLYIDGCRQELHNDAKNGRFAFVYSLTRNDRRSTGGETIVFRRGDPFLRNLRTASAHTNFYELIEPRFNRLVIFDDRLVHGVQLVEGSMDPVQGRIVMHGHIEESGPVVTGSLRPDQVLQCLRSPLELFYKEHGAPAKKFDGPFVLRFTITNEGRVGELRVMLDRVFTAHDSEESWSSLANQLIERLRGAVFPASAGETSVVLPLRFDGR